MKKKFTILSCFVFATVMFLNVNFLTKETTSNITLDQVSALACESMEGVGGGSQILLMDYCEVMWMEGEYTHELHGCYDAEATCWGYDY
ncbi:MAG TPA: hypothetical protein VEP89_02460 [Draconibacterium sp.]|nr:hypothetical protein [Draconibacterium sp.]